MNRIGGIYPALLDSHENKEENHKDDENHTDDGEN